MSSAGGWWQDDEDAPRQPAAEELPSAAPSDPEVGARASAHADVPPEEAAEAAPRPEPSTEPIAHADAFHDPRSFDEPPREPERAPSWPDPPEHAWPAPAAPAPASPAAVQLELQPINPDRPRSTAAGKPILQPAAVVYDTRTVRGKGRGRNTGRGRQPVAEKSSKIFGIDKKRIHRPYFTVIITFVDIVVFFFEVLRNKGFESAKRNPMIGPDAATLLLMGAKYGPLIKAGEWWRLITPIFMHVGIIHLLLNLLTQVTVGWSLEKTYGFYRIAPIYFISGVVGNICSTIFIPCNISVGASGALFGYMGVLFVDLIQNWKSLRNPMCNLITMIVTILISFALGLMPYLDNWVHIGGFVSGILAAVILLPNMYFVTKCCRRAKLISIMICVPLLLLMLVGGIVLIYKAVPSTRWCNWCRYLSCVPTKFWHCSQAAVNGTCY